MSKLLDYLNILDKDAAARAEHIKDPKAAMTKRGLSDKEQEAMMSGDKKQVANLLGISSDKCHSYIMPPSMNGFSDFSVGTFLKNFVNPDPIVFHQSA